MVGLVRCSDYARKAPIFPFDPVLSTAWTGLDCLQHKFRSLVTVRKVLLKAMLRRPTANEFRMSLLMIRPTPFDWVSFLKIACAGILWIRILIVLVA